MPFIAPELIIQAKQMDLLTYLKNYEPYELVKFSGNTYCTRTHDSLKISNGKWIWWSRGIGGRSALDYLIKVKGYSFLEAVETIIGHTAIQAPVYEKPQLKEENKPLLLPEKCASNRVITEYLFGRGIDFEIINYCISNDLIFESLPYHNVVFVGYDEKKEPKYAAYRSTNKRRIMGDCSGSKKDYSFRLGKENLEEVHLFECAIDLLSYATLAKLNGQDWKEMSFAVMIGTGLRVGEVTGLRWCDIDMESGMIDVNHTLVYYDHRTEGSKSGCYFNVNTTKTPASMRQVPMLGFVREAFEHEKQKQEDLGLHCEVTIDGYTDFIFINRFGQAQHQATLNKAIRRIIRDCNDEQFLHSDEPDVLLPHFSCHSLRHTFTTRMCEAGVNIKVIQDALGHSDISTTLNIYADVTKEMKAAEFKGLDSYFKG